MQRIHHQLTPNQDSHHPKIGRQADEADTEDAARKCRSDGATVLVGDNEPASEQEVHRDDDQGVVELVALGVELALNQQYASGADKVRSEQERNRQREKRFGGFQPSLHAAHEHGDDQDGGDAGQNDTEVRMLLLVAHQCVGGSEERYQSSADRIPVHGVLSRGVVIVKAAYLSRNILVR